MHIGLEIATINANLTALPELAARHVHCAISYPTVQNYEASRENRKEITTAIIAAKWK